MRGPFLSHISDIWSYQLYGHFFADPIGEHTYIRYLSITYVSIQLSSEMTHGSVKIWVTGSKSGGTVHQYEAELALLSRWTSAT